MNADERSFVVAVDAFRRATAREADGGATRARVFSVVEQRQRRAVALRRTGIAVALVIGAALSGRAAWTAIGNWRSPPPPSEAAVTVTPRPPVTVAARSPELAPPVVETPKRAAIQRDDGEARAYGRAHAAHFEADDPARALVLWETYLRAYPTGTFTPEARFNRALCLERLGRHAEAREALRPFAAGVYHDYRRREAETLLDWIGARD
jgi:hypothetical protein